MKRWIKWIILVIVLVLAVGLVVGYQQMLPTFHVATGYTAKAICSNHFLTGQDVDTIAAELPSNPLVPFLRTKVDEEERFVSVTLVGLAGQRAVYREGLGCTLMAGGGGKGAKTQISDLIQPSALDPNTPWPVGEAVSLDDLPAGVDGERLNAVLDDWFSEPDPTKPRRTRAVVIVKDGQIIAERYADGFTKDTPMLGWSMTKSVTNALIGILVKQGKLSLDQNAPVPEWSDPADPRHAITLDQLMRMSSGLAFSEDYADLTTGVTQMLYNTDDMPAYAAAAPLEAEPGGTWNYSSGTANIVSRIVRDTVGGSEEDYLTYPRTALFDRIGMTSAVMEPDASDTFVGSSYMYATARDWARFGLLFLQDGMWEGERILPEGWVDYSITPTPLSVGEYGAHWWLNAGEPDQPDTKKWPDLPTDLYRASGHDGQTVTIIPSSDLVIVRLGVSRDDETWDLGAFTADVLEVVP